MKGLKGFVVGGVVFIMVVISLSFSLSLFASLGSNKGDEPATPEQKKIVADILGMLRRMKVGKEIITGKLRERYEEKLPKDISASLKSFRFESDDESNNVIVSTDNYFYVKVFVHTPSGSFVCRELFGPDINVCTVGKNYLEWNEIEFSNGKDKCVSYKIGDFEKDKTYLEGFPDKMKCREVAIWKCGKHDFCGYEALLYGNPMIRFKRNGTVVHECNVSENTMVQFIDVISLKRKMELLPKDKAIDDLIIASERW